jgi:hypothetical protein
MTRKVFLLIVGAMTFAVVPQMTRAQSCAGSNLTYLVRDAKGAAIDAASGELLFTVKDWAPTHANFIRGKLLAPKVVRDLNGKLAALETWGMCSFSGPVSLKLTLQGKSMNLNFLTNPLPRDQGTSYLVDSVPFQPGTFEIALPVNSDYSPRFYPAGGWKKVSDKAEAVPVPAEMYVQGSVIDALTKNPVAGAQVNLIGYIPVWLAEKGKARTDGSGVFEMRGLRSDYMAAVYQAAIVAEHPDYASSYVLLYAREKMQSDIKKTPEPFKSVGGVGVELTPLVTVSGRVIDEATGGVPGDLNHLSVTFRYRDDDYLAGNILVPRGEATVKLKRDGSFTLRTAVGKNKILSDEPFEEGTCGKCYSLMGNTIEIEIPREGKSNLVLKLRSQGEP